MSEEYYTGYESALVPTPMGDSSSPEIEIKTDKPTNNPEKQPARINNSIPISGSNILNGYRSMTYNFTLAGLPKNYLKDPEAYRKGTLELVISKSGGKGIAGMSSPDDLRKSQLEVYDKYDSRLKKTAETSTGLIAGFNKDSPGRFDLFIDNLEIETLMAFSEQSNTTLPTKLKFDVIEPYSINGFIEALYVAAIAAGYTSYVSASFVLKLEFWGYPDGEDITEPVIIPNSTRYFPIGLTNVEVEITERGTRYSCTAVPFNERSFGQPSVIKKPIKMSGLTVKEILDNFMIELNKQVIQSDKDAKKDSTVHDTYKVTFKQRKEGTWAETADFDIPKSKIVELFQDNALYKFANPNEGSNAYKPGEKPKSIKYNPESTVINFQEGANVQDLITAIIRDSLYVRDTLKDLIEESTAQKRIDDYGFVNYFLITLEVTSKELIDKVAKRPYQEFNYIITPYKIHYTRIPIYGGSIKIKEEELQKISLRTYNYFYTGKNIDISTFKLNFNTLYFEAIPASLGDKNTPNTKDSASPSSGGSPQMKGTKEEDQKNNNINHPEPPVYVVPAQTQGTGGNAVPFQNDPYSTIAKLMHNSIVNSKASMITGEIEILGDPFYLVTGGIGNYNPKEVSGKFNIVGEDEVDYTKGEVNITINFRNPIDIGSFESGGSMYFDPNRVPFSGIYMVTKCNSTFRDGIFKQRLDIIRKPGQILTEDTGQKSVGPGVTTDNIPNPENTPGVDITTAFAPTQRLNEADVEEYLNRGFPSIGLPGEASNFINNIGGLGGQTTDLLNKTYGLVNKAGGLISNASTIGQALPSDVSTNIRLNISGLASLSNSVLAPAALLNAATNVITGNVTLKNAASSIAGKIIGATLSNTLQKSNQGSGIGEGATVKIPPLATTPFTSNSLVAGENINSINFSTPFNNAKGLVKDLSTNFINEANKLGADAAALINNVGDKIQSIKGSISDPAALGAKLGIDTAKLSGLSSNLKSKIPTQLSNILKEVPENVNLNQALLAGVALDIISPSKYKNIPPPTPFAVAPNPNTSPTPSLSKLSSPLSTPIDKNIVKDKVKSAQTQISNLTGRVNIVDNTVANSVGAKFGSKSSMSPLDKLFNNDVT